MGVEGKAAFGVDSSRHEVITLAKERFSDAQARPLPGALKRPLVAGRLRKLGATLSLTEEVIGLKGSLQDFLSGSGQ